MVEKKVRFFFNKTQNLQKKHIKQITCLEAFLEKIASILLLVFVISNPTLFGKSINNVENEINPAPAQIFISKDVIVYNVSGFENAEITNQNQPKQVEIYISDGTLICGTEYLGNVKITKIKSDSKKNSYKKQVLQKEKVVEKKISTKKTASKSIFFHHNSFPNTEFFLNESHKIVFSFNTDPSFLKPFYSLENYYKGLYHKEITAINYVNPSITISYFSGKYSVRPPTC